jgi:flagellar biosynthetic protein FlhB
MWTLKPLVPKFDKFNIVKGLKRLFSPRKLVDIPKNFFKLFIIGVAPYYVVKSEFRRLLYIMDSNAWQIMAFIGLILMKILFYVSIIMLLLALIDFVYQKWKFDQDLKMTKDEIKDERKQAEGDPKIKARIRRMQMEFVMKRMMTQVPEADVVVTNPIHLAVALKYDRQSMNAPQVVAKGARIIAEKIKEIARENNVPILENKPLAQSLYKMVEVGDTIPESLYKAVAEILAYVFRQKNNRYAEGQ